METKIKAQDSSSQTNAAVSLFEILHLANEIDRRLEESGGEITPDIEAMLSLTATHLPSKVDQWDYVIGKIEANADFLNDRAKQLSEAAAQQQKKADAIKGRLKSLMLEHGLTDLEGEYVRFKVSPTQPKLIIDDQEKIEVLYTRTEVVIDKARIKEDLKLGVPVKGAHLEESFSIRTYVNKAAGTKKVVAK